MTLLKEYDSVSALKLKSLLKRCVPNKKLLAFLELYPTEFNVQTKSSPHTVQLLSNPSQFTMDEKALSKAMRIRLFGINEIRRLVEGDSEIVNPHRLLSIQELQ